MTRRPWIGVSLSLLVHATLCALVVLSFSRDDWLPALVVDLREGFFPDTKAPGIRAGGSAPDGGTPASAPRRSRPPKRAVSPATPRAPEVASQAAAPVSPTVIAETPPPAIDPPRESQPSAVRAAERRAGVPPLEASDPAPKSLAGATAGDKPPPYGGAGSDKSDRGSSMSDSGGSASSSSDGSAGGPGGRAGQALALATPGGGSGVSAEYGPYLTALRQRIQQSVRYPASARRRGIAGTVNVEILILANGAVGDVQLLESSTHQVLDAAALETIRSLPRMPLPPDVPARPLRVRVPVLFQLQ